MVTLRVTIMKVTVMIGTVIMKLKTIRSLSVSQKH